MNKRKERALEAFLIVTFPIALFAGCAGNGDLKTAENQAPLDPMNEQTDAVGKGVITGEPIMESHVLEQDAELGINPDEQTSEIGEAPRYYGALGDETEISSAEGANNSVELTNTEASLASLASETGAEQNSDGNKTDDVKTVVFSTEKSMLKAPEQHIFGFASNQHQVATEDKEILQKHALFLIENPTIILTVAGHADSKGSVEYNKKLSEKRAKEVLNILISYGVPENQLIVDSYGEAVPLNDKDSLKENRRVELLYNTEVIMSSRL